MISTININRISNFINAAKGEQMPGARLTAVRGGHRLKVEYSMTYIPPCLPCAFCFSPLEFSANQ